MITEFDMTNFDLELAEEFSHLLLKVKRAFKRGEFNEQLKTHTMELFDLLHGRAANLANITESSNYYKAHTLLYELNDIFHLSVSAKIIEFTFSEGERIWAALQKFKSGQVQLTAVPGPESELVRRREQVLFCACRANELKRRGKILEARQTFLGLLEFTEKELSSDLFPCYGTRANLCFHLGSIYRIEQKYAEAEAKYLQALDWYYCRSQYRLSQGLESDDALISDLLFTNRRIAMVIGLGRGWLHLLRGFLTRSENALTSARALLARSNDPIVPAYIDLLLGTIKRCKAGRNNPTLLAVAIEILQQAKNQFTDKEHLRYKARACWELGLAYLFCQQLTKAEQQIQVIEDYAKTHSDLRWQVNAYVLRSRIRISQGRHVEALALADAALALLSHTSSEQQSLAFVDTYMTQGDAILALLEDTDQTNLIYGYSDAIKKFEKAISLLEVTKTPLGSTSSNPKIAAVCELRIAQGYIGLANEQQAEIHFKSGESLCASVEHGWVKALLHDVRGRLERMQHGFYINPDKQSDWNYAVNLKRMKNWLYHRAIQQTESIAEAARLLGVERATIYQWQKEPNSAQEVVNQETPVRKRAKKRAKQTPPSAQGE